jgi:hypothetical protein
VLASSPVALELTTMAVGRWLAKNVVGSPSEAQTSRGLDAGGATRLIPAADCSRLRSYCGN